MGLIRLTKIAALLLLTLTAAGSGQSHNQTTQPPGAKSRFIVLRLGEDEIGTIKTAARLSTRLSFREPVKEIVCGDLYDPTSGTGSFVVQRIDNDVFIKPVTSKGESNMFVKAGESGEHTFNLSLLIVSPEQAYTVVKVVFEADTASTPTAGKTRRARLVPATASIGSADFSLAANGNSNDAPFFMRNLPMFKELPPPPPTAVPAKIAPVARTPIRRVKPEYPEFARRSNTIGDVVVEVAINKEGSVKSVKVISGSGIFRTSAVSAARLWKFTPAINNQVQSQNTYLITFRFRGNGGETDALMSSSPRR